MDWELDYKEGWMQKNWYLWTVVLEKTLDSHLDCKEIQPVHPNGNQPWIFMRRTDAKAETPILWLPDTESWLKDLGQKEKRVTGWDGCMVSLTQWTWVWANSGRQWRTGKPGVLQSMGSQRIRHDWGTEQWHVLSRNFKKSSLSREVKSRPIYQQMVLTITHRVSLLAFSKTSLNQCLDILTRIWYCNYFSLVFVVQSLNLWTHWLKHARLPCPSPSPRVCSNSCPLSWWCHSAISSSVTPFTSYPQSFPASGSLSKSRLITSI